MVLAATAANSGALCKCICGLGSNKERTVDGPLEMGQAGEAQEPAVETLPLVTGRLRYSISADQTLRGTPIREGELWYLSAEERVEQVTFSLHVNGFAFVHGAHETQVSLSPFCLVRNCKFQSNYSNSNLMDMKIFKVSLFAQGECHYLGVRAEEESEAEEERSQWVIDISRVMRLVTQSVFPPFRISCEPLSAVVSTQRRLMAGYLIHRDDERVASVVYVELHPQCEDQAKLVLYENELCQVPVADVYLTEQSLCCEKVGINCSCFCVEDHQFSTRTLAERKLWLRAISNVKVKLQNRAPSPDHEELQHYREAVKEHLQNIRTSVDVQAPMDPLLQFLPTGPGPPPPGGVPIPAAFALGAGLTGLSARPDEEDPPEGEGAGGPAVGEAPAGDPSGATAQAEDDAPLDRRQFGRVLPIPQELPQPSGG